MLQTDSKVDMVRCREATKGRVVLMGNVDTTLMATCRPEAVEDAARAAIQAMGRHGWFFLSSGCTIGATTPAESTHALLSAAERQQDGVTASGSDYATTVRVERDGRTLLDGFVLRVNRPLQPSSRLEWGAYRLSIETLY